MTALADLIREAAARLRAAGVDSPRPDAEWLAEHAFGLRRSALRRAGATVPAPDAAERFAALVDRRAAREPLQRILGSWEFWGLDLELGPGTLIPRPDTETVVEAVLGCRPDRTRPWRILDLGTGSGAILLALATEYPYASCVGTDIDPGAAAIAARNARRLNLSERAVFLCCDWDAALAAAQTAPAPTGLAPTGLFDIVVSNPPYIPDAEIDGLMPEVARHEPRRALAGGPDGLAPYRAIAAALPRLLARGGLAVLEHGADQGASVRAIVAAAGLVDPVTLPDLGGRDRIVVATAP